jgi:hypothetical protein
MWQRIAEIDEIGMRIAGTWHIVHRITLGGNISLDARIWMRNSPHCK